MTTTADPVFADRVASTDTGRLRVGVGTAFWRNVAVMTRRNLIHIAPRTAAAFGRDRATGPVHVAVRLRVRRRRRAPARRQLQGLRDRRPADAEPHDLGDGHGRRSQHRPHHRRDRPLPDAADVAAADARRSFASPTCSTAALCVAIVGDHRAGDRLAADGVDALGARRLRRRAAVQLRDVVGLRVPRHRVARARSRPRASACSCCSRWRSSRTRWCRPSACRGPAGHRRLEPGQRGRVGVPGTCSATRTRRAPIHAWPMQHPVVAASLWSLVMLAIFVPLASYLFRRKTTE